MFVPFESLPPASRVWVFQASHPFTAHLSGVHERLKAFTEEWSVHGMPLDTSYTVAFDQFIILAADESAQSASGCSIDSSVHALKSIEQAFGVSLFDRNLVAFKTDTGVMTLPLQELKQKFSEGILNGDSLTFNNLVSTKAEFQNRWIVPASETWLKRYMARPLAKVD